MVIQRWQSVLLFLAAIAVAVFCCTSFASYPDGAGGDPIQMFVKDVPVLLTVSILVGILLLISIFMYKNLNRQITVTKISMILLVAAIVTGVFVTYNTLPDAELVFFGGIMLLVVAMILAIGAYRLMKSDLRKLRSYDRLR